MTMTQKGRSRIYDPCLQRRASKAVKFPSVFALVVAIASAAIAHDGLSKELPPSTKTRIQRVPDTWAVTATEGSVFFELGSSALDNEATEVIRRHAEKLKANRSLHITLIAHTDDLGSSSLELAIGQERLNAVRRQLEDLRVSPGKIRTENHGSEIRNAAICIDADCRYTNRRVDCLFGR